MVVLKPPATGFDTPFQRTWTSPNGRFTIAGDLALDNQLRFDDPSRKPTLTASTGVGAAVTGELTMNNIRLTGGGVIVDTRTYSYESMSGRLTLTDGKNGRPVLVLGAEWGRTRTVTDEQTRFGTRFNRKATSEGQRIYLGVCLNNPDTALGVQFVRQTYSDFRTLSTGGTEWSRQDQNTFKVTFITPNLELSWSEQRSRGSGVTERYASFKIDERTQFGITHLEYKDRRNARQELRFGLQRSF